MCNRTSKYAQDLNTPWCRQFVVEFGPEEVGIAYCGFSSTWSQKAGFPCVMVDTCNIVPTKCTGSHHVLLLLVPAGLIMKDSVNLRECNHEYEDLAR